MTLDKLLRAGWRRSVVPEAGRRSTKVSSVRQGAAGSGGKVRGLRAPGFRIWCSRCCCAGSSRPNTAHGFRRFFPAIGPATKPIFPRELAEHALAHVIGDEAEQAYRRIRRAGEPVGTDGRMGAALRRRRGRQLVGLQEVGLTESALRFQHRVLGRDRHGWPSDCGCQRSIAGPPGGGWFQSNLLPRQRRGGAPRETYNFL